MTTDAELLDVDGRTIKLSHPDKVVYPADGTTKADIVAYYRAIADTFVAHAARRPVTRKRWVHGVGAPSEHLEGFFAKNLDSGTPAWVERRAVRHTHQVLEYPLADGAAVLAWWAQLGALELHVPQWRFPDGVGVDEPLSDSDLPHPDRLVLDLDPGEGVGLDACVELAWLLKEILDGVGLTSVPVTSGSKGIHVYAGLDGAMSCADASDFAKQLATSLQAARPDLVIADMKRSLRSGLILLDWSQNNGAKTTIAPYSLRGRQRPWVAAPRDWSEIAPGLQQLDYREVLERLATVGDPLAALLPEGKPDAVPVATPSGAPPEAPAKAPAKAPSVTIAAASGPLGLDAVPAYEPMLAALATDHDAGGPGWTFEVKWDGYRGLARAAHGRHALASRKGVDYTATFPELAEVAELMGGHAAVLDGEIVALDTEGRSRFELLHHRTPATPVHYMAFDLLWLDGEPLIGRPYSQRRAALEALIGGGGVHVLVPPTLGTDRDLALEASRVLGAEGVVAKRTASPYAPGGRGRDWLKIKHVRHQAAVVIGWAPGRASRTGAIGSLALAVHEGGELRYIGRVGTGFTARDLADAQARLVAHARPDCPAVGVPDADARGVHWADPVLVGEISYAEFTPGGLARHAVWRGWRDDLDAADVVAEVV